MSGLSVHAVDVASGRPAEGMRVEILALSPERRVIAEGRLGASGLLDHPVARERLAPGLYEVVFHVGDWLGTPDAFLDTVPYRFRLADPGQHYHLPFKFTPWGFSLFRGS